MTKYFALHIIAAAVLPAALLPAQAGTVRLDQLDLTAAPGRSAFRKDHSTGGQPIRLGGVVSSTDWPCAATGNARLYLTDAREPSPPGSARTMARRRPAPKLSFLYMATITSFGAAARAGAAKRPVQCRVQLAGVTNLALDIVSIGGNGNLCRLGLGRRGL